MDRIVHATMRTLREEVPDAYIIPDDILFRLMETTRAMAALEWRDDAHMLRTLQSEVPDARHIPDRVLWNIMSCTWCLDEEREAKEEWLPDSDSTMDVGSSVGYAADEEEEPEDEGEHEWLPDSDSAMDVGSSAGCAADEREDEGEHEWDGGMGMVPAEEVYWGGDGEGALPPPLPMRHEHGLTPHNSHSWGLSFAKNYLQYLKVMENFPKPGRFDQGAFSEQYRTTVLRDWTMENRGKPFNFTDVPKHIHEILLCTFIFRR